MPHSSSLKKFTKEKNICTLPDSQATPARLREQLTGCGQGAVHLLLAHAVQQERADVPLPAASTRLDAAVLALQAWEKYFKVFFYNDTMKIKESKVKSQV